jgi:hypothetical protein
MGRAGPEPGTQVLGSQARAPVLTIRPMDVPLGLL